MSPFLQFRLWARRGPTVERAGAAVAAVVVLTLVAWAAVPASGPGAQPGATGSSTLSANAGGRSTAPGGAGSTAGPGPAGGTGSPSAGAAVAGSGPAAGTSGAGASPSGAPVASSPGASGGSAGGKASCAAPGATDQGVSATQIHMGVVILSLAGPVGNQAVGVASPQVQQQVAQALIDDINRAGGVQCRKLVPTYYQVNPVDSVNQHSECLQMAQDGLFAVVDGGGFSYPIASRDCVVQNKIPLFSQVGLVPTEGNKQFYPYLFTPAGVYDIDMRDVVLGAQARGYFTASQGFRRLGLLEDDCTTEVNGDLDAALSRAGIGGSQISRFVFACPSTGFAPPSAMAQAVEQFKLDGVTNVIPITGGGSFTTFTRIAQQQDFRPHYAVSDYDGLASTVESAQGPDPQNFDGAIATIPWRLGALASNLPLDPATARCNQQMTAHGLPTMAESSAIQGVYCALFTMFTTAADRAPQLTRTALVTGLDGAGHIGFSYPFADGSFDRPHKTAGGDFWRPTQWHADCTCWKVLDPTYKPSFT